MCKIACFCYMFPIRPTLQEYPTLLRIAVLPCENVTVSRANSQAEKEKNAPERKAKLTKRSRGKAIVGRRWRAPRRRGTTVPVDGDCVTTVNHAVDFFDGTDGGRMLIQLDVGSRRKVPRVLRDLD